MIYDNRTFLRINLDSTAVVEAYLSGKSSMAELAKKYGVTDESCVRDWLMSYNTLKHAKDGTLDAQLRRLFELLGTDIIKNPQSALKSFRKL